MSVLVLPKPSWKSLASGQFWGQTAEKAFLQKFQKLDFVTRSKLKTALLHLALYCRKRTISTRNTVPGTLIVCRASDARLVYLL